MEDGEIGRSHASSAGVICFGWGRRSSPFVHVGRERGGGGRQGQNNEKVYFDEPAKSFGFISGRQARPTRSLGRPRGAGAWPSRGEGIAI